MKRIILFSSLIVLSILALSSSFFDDEAVETSERLVTQEGKDYWYDGTAEISSFKLSQARYGQMREGTAVLIYVTEPFSKSSNTKADNQNDSNVPVLKLNTTKNFLTGIYPYSMMNSTFYPFENGDASLKTATSIQEWCGMAYLEMKNNGEFLFNLNSYFEGRSFRDKRVEKVLLEDDLWSLIRLNPELLPIGKHQVIPSAFYTLLKHKPVKAYDANIRSYIGGEGGRNYEINYPSLERTLTIKFNVSFPYEIIGWEERYPDGAREGLSITKAERIKTIKTAYWNQGSLRDEVWRDTLGL